MSEEAFGCASDYSTYRTGMRTCLAGDPGNQIFIRRPELPENLADFIGYKTFTYFDEYNNGMMRS